MAIQEIRERITSTGTALAEKVHGINPHLLLTRLALATPLALTLACSPHPAPMTPEQLDDYMAGLNKVPATSVPAPEPTKEAFNPQDPRVREIYQPPVPGLAGGGAPDLLSPVPSATPARPVETVSQEQALVMIKTIADAIKNPDPEVVKKYNIPQKLLTNEQIGILYGGEDKSGTSGLPKTPDGHAYMPDSLAGVETLIRAGDLVSAKALIKKLFPTVGNASFDDIVVIRMTPEEAFNLDPEKLFISFPPLPNRPAWGGSEVKKDAAMGLIKLYYGLPS